MKWDFVVIGAGITGIELAALLANDGRKVLVLEKGRHIGGRAFLWEKDGFTVDYGVHLVRFGPKSALSKAARAIGHKIAYHDLGKSFVQDEDGEVKEFPTSPKGFFTTKMLNAREKLSLIKIMVGMIREDFSALKTTSVEEWMDKQNMAGGMRRYFHLVSASMQVCPFIEKASAGEMLMNMQKVLKAGKSVMYPKGGWEPLYDMFTSKIKENGEIRTEAKVERINVNGGKAIGVVVNGETIEAGAVVNSVPAQELFDILDPALCDDGYVNMCRNLRPTAGIVLDYGLNKKIHDSSGLWYMWDPMSFGIFTSNLEPALAPQGKQLLTWYYPTSLEDVKDEKIGSEKLEKLEKALEALFPGLKEATEWKRALKLKMVDGVEVNINQHSGLRPGFKVPGIEKLYMVGDSTAAHGAGGDIGQESVHDCYKAIKADLP